MPPRDELLVVIDLTSTIIRAGVGVHDLIRGPLVELSTRIGRRAATVPYKITDYVVGKFLVEAEESGEALEIIHPMIVGRAGLEVDDWTGLEAIFRYIFHVALLLPRPPLAHPVALSLPPHLPPLLVDTFHSLLFERLLIPQLLVDSRPFFAAAAAGVVNAVVLDIGAKGEGSEISVVTDSQVYESATSRFAVDEGNLDDWLALQLLLEEPKLPILLSPDAELSQEELLMAVRMIIASLKEGDVIAFSAPLAESIATSAMAVDEDGALDIAKVLVEGKVDKVIGRKEKKGKEKNRDADEGDFVEVPHPLDGDLEAIQIGPARHRYLEPLFQPSLLAELAPSFSPTAKLLGFTEYEEREIMYSGVQEVMGTVVEQAIDAEARRQIWEAVVIISSGRVSRIKELSTVLISLLSPHVIDPESGSEIQAKSLRYVKVPDYFSEFKERGQDWGCYLGGCIMSKILISDTQSKMFMSKTEYSTRGPASYRLLEAL